MKSRHPLYHRSSGFSLVEVLVALIVMSVGLLGIAKMQAVALSNTSVSSQRSLAALEAASLAASMHANRGYWGAAGVAGKITVQGGTVTPLPAAAKVCTAVMCVPAEMATYDLQQWATSLQTEALLPNYLATINCAILTTPRSCTINITWSEKSVALNTNAAGQAESAIAINQPDYELYVEP
ncbi:MAG: type IV pilus modification protein PilV [Steroidobacteraceae bacterium]